MTETNNLDVNKKLSEDLETKINKVNARWNKTKEEYKHDILDIYETALSEGYSPTNAGKLCREKINIFSDKTIMRALPDAATRSYNKPNWTNVQINNQRRLIVPEEPTLPPRPEVVREAQIVRELPKAIDHPITIPTPKPYIIFRQKQWRDKYNWDTSHTLKLVLDNTRENIIDVRPMMEAKK